MRLSPICCSGVAVTAMFLLMASYESRAQTIASDDSAVVPLDFLPALAGDYFRLKSDVIGRAFHIYINLPQSYDPDSSRAYPVVFVLDGDSLFPVIAPTHLFMTIDNDVPEAVVVGIAYGSFDPPVNMRGYDFTAPATDASSAQGGAKDFHTFLKEELIPTVERRYRIDSSRRILFGQSRGGGMVLYSAFSDPDVFWGRIANNPTFDPGREMFFSPPEDAGRDDLGLVVTSGSSDMPLLREAALEWFSAWEAADEIPWRLHAVTIEGGTHASYSADSYRCGILWLFAIDD